MDSNGAAHFHRLIFEHAVTGINLRRRQRCGIVKFTLSRWPCARTLTCLIINSCRSNMLIDFIFGTREGAHGRFRTETSKAPHYHIKKGNF